MKEKVQVTRLTCDGCGKEQLCYEDDPGSGYHGAGVQEVDAAGGRSCHEWFACSARCIGNAVVAAIARENNGGDWLTPMEVEARGRSGE